MKVLGIVACLAMLMSFGALAGPTPNTPLLGYQCYTIDAERLGLSREDFFTGRGLPSILEAPEVDAKVVLAPAPLLVYVKWPLEIENGIAVGLEGRVGEAIRGDVPRVSLVGVVQGLGIDDAQFDCLFHCLCSCSFGIR